MEYIEQKLVAWQLNGNFNKIDNCEIVKPSRKWVNTYWDTFFIKKRDSLNELWKSKPTWDVVDSIEIEWTEYLLIFNWTNIEVAYDNWSEYIWIWITETKTDDTPYRLIKWKSAQWDFITWITIADAFFDWHDKWTWVSATDYIYNDIVQYNTINYICISANTNKQPDTETDSWSVYSGEEWGYDKLEPLDVKFKDVYQWWYLKLKLTYPWIKAMKDVLVWQHLFFDHNKSNLQWISTKIHYTADYNDHWNTDEWDDTAIADNELFVYIRWTNLAGSRPYVWELVSISTKVWGLPILASSTKVISLHPTKVNNVVTAIKQVELYVCSDDDEIIDMITYNWVMFILTKNVLLYSRILTESNINLYPLDFFNDIRWWLKIVWFWKMLVLFWENNAVITPINWTTGSVWYVYTDLNYDNNLYSKYSVLSTMGSLYVLQADKQFVKIDIKSVTNIDYDVETSNAISDVRWMFDWVYWEVFMNMYWKDIYILSQNSWMTDYYKYNIEYKHWDIWQYSTTIYKVDTLLYGTTVYETNNNTFDYTNTNYIQEVWFDFWWDNLHTLKQVQFIKLIFWLNDEILDYELEVEHQLWWKIFKTTIDLSGYPINIELIDTEWLWDSLIWSTLIWEWTSTTTVELWNFVSVTVWLTWSVFNFNIKSKTNEFIYWGSIIWYDNKLPTVTEFNYKH